MTTQIWPVPECSSHKSSQRIPAASVIPNTCRVVFQDRLQDSNSRFTSLLNSYEFWCGWHWLHRIRHTLHVNFYDLQSCWRSHSQTLKILDKTLSGKILDVWALILRFSIRVELRLVRLVTTRCEGVACCYHESEPVRFLEPLIVYFVQTDRRHPLDCNHTGPA